MWSEVNYKVVPLFALQLVLGLNWEKNFWVEINCLRRWTSSLLDLYFLPFRSCWFPRPRPPPPTQHRHQLIDGVRFYNTRCVWANDMERVINRNIRPAFPWRHTRTSSCHSPNERFVVQCWETNSFTCLNKKRAGNWCETVHWFMEPGNCVTPGYGFWRQTNNGSAVLWVSLLQRIVRLFCKYFRLRLFALANKPVFIPIILVGLSLPILVIVASPYQLIPPLWRRLLQIFIY